MKTTPHIVKGKESHFGTEHHKTPLPVKRYAALACMHSCTHTHIRTHTNTRTHTRTHTHTHHTQTFTHTHAGDLCNRPSAKWAAIWTRASSHRCSLWAFVSDGPSLSVMHLNSNLHLHTHTYTHTHKHTHAQTHTLHTHIQSRLHWKIW